MGNRMDLDNATAICTEIGNKRQATFSASETEIRDTVGWTGKNKLCVTLSELKTRNTSGTWSGNTYTLNSLSYICTVDNDYVTKITVNGTPPSRTDFMVADRQPYTETDANVLTGTNGGSSGTYKLQMYDSTTSTAYDDTGSGVTIPITVNGHHIGISIITYANVTMSNIEFYPMIRSASISDSTYEPYHESVEEWGFPRSEQRVLGAKNIIPNKAVSKSQNNVTWVVNADKSITISSNNSSADTFISISSKTQYLLPEGNYILSDECGDSDVYTYIERRKGASGTANYVRTDSSAHSATFTVDYSEYDYYSIDIFVPSGMTFSNKEFKPMIRLANEPDDTYIQPAMTNTGLTQTLEALATIQEGTVTSTFNIDATDKTVKKQGNIVIPCVNIANVTATAYETVVATIPEGFRPSKTTRILVIIAGAPRSAYVEANGNVKLQVGASSERVFISGTCWITT